MAREWGPSHHATPPIPGIVGGGYWRGIAAGGVLGAFWLSRYTLGGDAAGWREVAAPVALMCTVAVALGIGERRRGRGFASGHWVAFTIATIAVAASVAALPAIAYIGGYYGRDVTAWAARRRDARAVAAAAGPRSGRENASPASLFGQSAPAAAVRSRPLPAIAGGYLGVDKRGRDVRANPRGALLLLGPPGSGKTQTLCTSIAMAPAACIAVSIKAELLALTAAARRTRGRVFWFDPGGTEPPPPGVEPLRWNPLVDVTGWDAARSVAARLAAPARPQAGSGHGGDHWTDRAESWLSVLLLAAKLATPGGDLDSLARWAMAPTAGAPEVEALLIVAAEDGEPGAEIARTLLDSLLNTPDRERESIASTLARLLNIYTSTAALAAGRAPNFDPAAFVRSAGDSVFIGCPPDRQRDYAPLITGLLESIRLAQYNRRQAVDLGTESQSAPVTLILDEAATVAGGFPLVEVVSNSGGQGLHVVVALQDMSQARARWGDAAASGFLTLFPDKFILSGMNDRATAEMMSKASGEFDRMTVSVSVPGAARGGLFGPVQAPPTQSYSTSRTPVLSVADIAGVPAGQGLHWHPGGWQLLTLRPWWRARQAYGL